MDVTLADGRTVSIDTEDPAVAATAAHKFQSENPLSPVDRFTGAQGERYQTWPERLVRGLQSLPERAIRSAAEYSRTGEYNPAPIVEAATLATPLPAAMRAGERAIPGVAQAPRRQVPVATPSAKELAEAGGADIQAGRQSVLDIAAPAIGEQSRKVQQELFDRGIHPVDAPATYAKLKELENAPSSSVFTASNLQSFRESLGHTAQNFNPGAAKDQLAASVAIKGFDQLLPSVAPEAVLAGSPAATQALFERGRGNYAAGMRSGSLTEGLGRARTGIGERAEARAQAANSGRNIDNTIRQRVEGFLERPKEVSGFNDPELAALDRVVQGGGGRNTARYIGNTFGGGGGVAPMITSAIGAASGGAAGGLPGASVGAALGAVPPMVGAGARSVANLLARRDLAKADELVRQRSPLFLGRQAQAGTMPVTPEARAAVLRSLLAEQYQ